MAGAMLRARIGALVVTALVVATAAQAAAPATGFEVDFVAPASDAPRVGSAFAVATPGLDRIGPSPSQARSISSREGGKSSGLKVLSAERASILLRSLTVPGWGQATLGHNGSAKFFFLVETAVWASFFAFKVQEDMRRETYERTAQIDAGIDLSGRDEEYRRIVGSFLSSDSYNQFVVYRDAANLYYDDPVAYRAYIAEHEIKGADAWHWSSEEDLLRYRAQRKDSQRADQRANTALAVAVLNRFVSALHAARLAGRPAQAPHSWNFELAPAGDGDALALRCGMRARF